MNRREAAGAQLLADLVALRLGWLLAARKLLHELALLLGHVPRVIAADDARLLIDA